MADFGESADLEILFDRHDEDCYFCNKKAETEARVNDNVADHNEDEKAALGFVADPDGITHRNHSGKLGKNCGDTMPERITMFRDDWVQELQASFAAHHLIPGDESLKPSQLFQDDQNGLKTQGKAEGNVGYDVNNTANGVWLPGNYAYSQGKKSVWGEGGKDFEALYLITVDDYSGAAIEVSGAQYHDRHKDYSDHVLNLLNQIHLKFEVTQAWCPEASKRPDRPKPLYALVNRLAAVSGRLRRMLTFPTTAWRTEIYTSKYSFRWMSRQTGNVSVRAPR